MARKLKCTDAVADYAKYIYYLKGKGKKKSLYRARRRTGKAKKALVKNVVENKKNTLFYAKADRSGRLCVYKTPMKRSRKRKRSKKTKKRSC